MCRKKILDYNALLLQSHQRTGRGAKIRYGWGPAAALAEVAICETFKNSIDEVSTSWTKRSTSTITFTIVLLKAFL